VFIALPSRAGAKEGRGGGRAPHTIFPPLLTWGHPRMGGEILDAMGT